MNILMFNYEYPPVGGGGAVVHELLAEELARRHRVVVITSAFGASPRREIRHGVEIRRVPVLARRSRSAASLLSLLSYPPSAWLEARRLLTSDSFDVINSHFAVPSGVASLPVARLWKIPHILTIQGGDIYDPSKRLSPHRIGLLRMTVAKVMRDSAEVVAASENTRSNAHHFYNFDGAIRIIPLGIRIPEVLPASREELGVPADRFVLATVGRLVRRKAVDRLLHIIQRPECNRAHVVVIGAGPEMNALRDLAGQLGVSDRVQFTGWVAEEQKWQLLRVSDAYVSSSMHEGFGLVFLEGMAAGLPIVTGDHGGQVDFLSDGETGFVTPAGDERAMAEAIGNLIREPARAKNMGKLNATHVERYRIERCAEAYETLFEEVIHRQGRGSSSVAAD